MVSETSLSQEASAGPFLVQPVLPQFMCKVSPRWSLSKEFESKLGHLSVKVCTWAECLTPLSTDAVRSKQVVERTESFRLTKTQKQAKRSIPPRLFHGAAMGRRLPTGRDAQTSSCSVSSGEGIQPGLQQEVRDIQRS